eukprot:6463388-Amphidinium_carterae.1
MQLDKTPKGKGKEGKNQQDGEKPASKKLKLCRYFQTSTGCKDGDKCSYDHPWTRGKCLRCGAEDHLVSMCQRPKREGGKGSKGSGKGKGKKKEGKDQNQTPPKSDPNQAANAAEVETSVMECRVSSKAYM